MPPGNCASAAAFSCPGGPPEAVMVPSLAISAGEKLPVIIPGVGTVARQQTRVQHLVEILEAGEEEQLVAILVEPGAGNQHRAADGAAGIVVLVLRLRRAARIVTAQSLAFRA